MAGVLPGVEAARIRRFHQSGGVTTTRRSSFGLYANTYQEFRSTSPSSSMERQPMRWGGCDDEKLDDAAREAKKRLDRRLQTHCKSHIKRKVEGQEGQTYVEGRLKSSQNKSEIDHSERADAKLTSGKIFLYFRSVKL